MEKSQQTTKMHEKFPRWHRVNDVRQMRHVFVQLSSNGRHASLFRVSYTGGKPRNYHEIVLTYFCSQATSGTRRGSFQAENWIKKGWCHFHFCFIWGELIDKYKDINANSKTVFTDYAMLKLVHIVPIYF